MSLNKIAESIDLIHKNKKEGAVLVGISGIDAAGKGTVAKHLKKKLESGGLKVALVGVEEWHEPQTIRLKKPYDAFHFYSHAFRWNDLFGKLILPLKKNRSVDLMEKLIHVHADIYFEYQYLFEDIDVILLEGIFLFKKELEKHFDFKIWISCDYETALDRAKMRNQENREMNELVMDYGNIYFPAQEIHLQKDDVLYHANAVFINFRKENLNFQ